MSKGFLPQNRLSWEPGAGNCHIMFAQPCIPGVCQPRAMITSVLKVQQGPRALS